MTWTYTDPSASSKDAVRLRIGDTLSGDPQLSDEEITYFINAAGSDVLTAAGLAVRALSAKYARQVDKSVGPVSVSYGQRSEHYKALADEIWAEAGGEPMALVAAYCGGISVVDKKTREDDPDRVQPAFTRDTLGSSELPESEVAGDDKWGWPA